ncbi:putative gustatory receptor 2a [Anopheles cruzii]|uniref:putative gustatory receptor 2a n=1 Tax=Anopheles cruzii TaxID=68878 RepID=UPI0022EC6D26|nr:putative gustatory receptor 2a [Anopheles cruzii]
MAQEPLPVDQPHIRTQQPPPPLPLPPKLEDHSRESFVRCVRPLYFLSKVFALWCFTVQWKNHPQARQSAFRTSRWCVFHSLAVLMLYSTFHLYTNYADSYGQPKGGGVATESPETTARGEVNFVSVVIDVYNRYSGLVLFWLLHAVAFIRRRTVVDIMRAVLCIDEQFHDRLSIAPDHGAWCRFVCLHIALIFLAIGLCEWYNCVMYISDFKPASEYCIFQCLTTMLTSTTVQIQYVALVQLIKTRLALISRLLVELDDYGREQANARMKIINDIKNLYTHLHLLSLNINQAYGAQLIFILMTLFVTLTTLLYHCTMKLLRMLLLGRHATFETLRPLFWEVLSTLSWICIATVSILRICSVCDSTKNEVRLVGSLIHGLGWSTDCSFTKSTVRTLSLQLLQQRIEFSAGGLFAIDHGLMFNIVAALATFLLILVQFDIAQGGDKWKTLEATARNGTAL